MARLTARHGDSWRSPRWAVALDGAPAVLSNWHVRAQARKGAETGDPILEWTSGTDTVVIGSAEVRLADNTLLVTDTVQLLIRPGDWAGVPRKWSGLVEVEIASDDSDDPAERHTIVPARAFTISPDVVR